MRLSRQSGDLRKRGNEFGSVTGRSRRVGWLDLPTLQYSCDASNITSLIVTKLDVLDGMDEIKICNKYNKNVFCGNDFEGAIPEYVSLPGWKNRNDPNMKKYLNYIQDYLQLPIKYFTCGLDDEKDIVSL